MGALSSHLLQGQGRQKCLDKHLCTWKPWPQSSTTKIPCKLLISRYFQMPKEATPCQCSMILQVWSEDAGLCTPAGIRGFVLQSSQARPSRSQTWAETWLRFALGAGAHLTLSTGSFMPCVVNVGNREELIQPSRHSRCKSTSPITKKKTEQMQKLKPRAASGLTRMKCSWHFLHRELFFSGKF